MQDGRLLYRLMNFGGVGEKTNMFISKAKCEIADI
jgi:hypothetical protein